MRAVDLSAASPDAARAIAVAVLGRDPGTMATAESSSHSVYVSSDVVVKIIDAAGHSRLDREIMLAPHLPAGLSAPLLGSGFYRLGVSDVRYACYAHVSRGPAARSVAVPRLLITTRRRTRAGSAAVARRSARSLR